MKILTGLITILILLLLSGPVLAVEFTPIVNFSIEAVTEQVPGLEQQVTSDSIYALKPRVDERYVTWVAYSAGEGKVWYFDTQGGKRDMVSNVPGDQNDPDISDGKIVWDDTRNGCSDIYSYDIASNKEDVVYSSTSNKFRPAISKGMVVFEDYGTSDNRNIGVIKAGSTTKPIYINQNQKDKANPDIDGDWVVYQQLDDGKSNWDIYAYNLKTQQTLQITTDTATHQYPRISGDLVVWEDNRNGKWDVFMYDLKKDITSEVTYDDLDDREPSVSGSNIVWTRYEQDGSSHVYMVNLQIPKSFVVSIGPGNQIKPDICVDKVAWQDDRFGKPDVYLYTLRPYTPFKSYQFYGPVSINHLPAPVGTQILAKVDGKTKDTITVTQAGYYGGQGSFANQLTVNVNQADLGKYITFWADGFQGTPSIPIAGNGSMQELSLNFMYAQPLPDLFFYGSVLVDGQPAEKGTKITAKIDDVVRGEYTITQTGQYGGSGPQDPALDIAITENDLGKHVTFWQGDYKAAETVQITSGGKFRQDLTFTQVSPITPYEFYGYVQFDGKSAPAGTSIQAQIDGVPATTYVTRYAGSYGGPGDNPEDARLVVPVKEADVGKTISFWSGTQRASASQIIARSGERVVRKDLDFSSSSGIVADFTADPTSGSAPLTVKFTDLSSGSPTMWVWDFGDGPIPMDASCSGGGCNNIANPTHTYTTAGTYTVTLTASNQKSSDTRVKTGFITVGGSSSFRADFTASPTSGSAPLTVKFTDLTTGSPTMWVWDFGDGPIPLDASCSGGGCNNIANPTHTYTTEGTYTVTLTASNQKNSDTRVKTGFITVGGSPSFKADFTASPTSGTSPLTVKFTDLTVGGPTMWSWDFGDGSSDMVGSPTHTYTRDGVYTVTLRASNQYGNSDTQVKQSYITVGSTSAFKADFTAAPTSGPSPLTVKFTDLTVGGPTMWSWDFGDGSSDMVGSPTHTYTRDGVYTVTLRASNQYGNSDTQVKQSYITVGGTSAFKADFTATPTSGPAPLTVKFTDKTVGGPTMWVWDFGDGPIPMNATSSCSGGGCNNIANPTHTYTRNGAYTVTLTASNQYGGSDTASKANYINVRDTPSSDAIPISAGWNFVSIPKKLVAGKDTAAIFGNIEVDGHSIFQYDSVRGQWMTLNQTSLIKPLDAVWLYSKKADSVPLTFDSDPLQIPPTRELKKGWNAIGFTGFEPLEAKFTFLSVQDKWVNCLGFSRELQKYNEMIIKGRNEDTKLTPYNGYWLFMSDDGVLAAISA